VIRTLAELVAITLFCSTVVLWIVILDTLERGF